MKKSVIVLGKGSLAIRVAQWFSENDAFDLRGVVPVKPEPQWTDSLVDWSTRQGIHVIESGHYRDIPGCSEESWSVDLVFSVFYDRIVKPWFIAKCGRILNLHNAPLPRYRGCAPINWALKNGEHEHGVTIHELNANIDAGPIVSQVRFTIDPVRDEVIDVYRRCLAFGWTLFEQTMPILDRTEPAKQEESRASYFSREDEARLGDRRDFTRAKSRTRSSLTASLPPLRATHL